MQASLLPAAIVGLGNPGPKHAADRHNAGFWLLERLAVPATAQFRDEAKLAGSHCQVAIGGQPVRLVKPATFMNRSGQCVRRLMDYFQIPLAAILVVHDDVDLPPGTARLKSGGGHGGNNGLRDIIAHCGADFPRLRLGVGHPGSRDDVAGYVLHRPSGDEQGLIDFAIAESLQALETWFAQGFQRAVTRLHTATPPDAGPGPAG
ncbi:MAG: aminoacyl-tRNA hydrolase [Gammaproteobacteria bacterium]|nr:MAG: aminoacyl-tRNA hydrolase [Gammaproteobacteria bacterium]